MYEFEGKARNIVNGNPNIQIHINMKSLWLMMLLLVANNTKDTFTLNQKGRRHGRAFYRHSNSVIVTSFVELM